MTEIDFLLVLLLIGETILLGVLAFRPTVVVRIDRPNFGDDNSRMNETNHPVSVPDESLRVSSLVFDLFTELASVEVSRVSRRMELEQRENDLKLSVKLAAIDCFEGVGSQSFSTRAALLTDAYEEHGHALARILSDESCRRWQADASTAARMAMEQKQPMLPGKGMPGLPMQPESPRLPWHHPT